MVTVPLDGLDHLIVVVCPAETCRVDWPPGMSIALFRAKARVAQIARVKGVQVRIFAVAAGLNICDVLLSSFVYTAAG